MANFAGKGLNIDLVGANKVLTATKADTTGSGGTAARTATTSAFTIRYGAATSVAFLAQPGGAVAAAALGTQPVVEILDAAGNVVTGGVDANAQVTLSLGSGSGTLSGTTSVAAVAGVATFAGLSIDLVGNKTLVASKADTAGTITAGVSRGTPASQITSNSFTITQDTALHLVFSTQPSGGVAGQVWGTQPVVKIVDAHGNGVTTGADSSRVITMTLSQGTGPLGGTLTATAVAGVATFTNLKANAIGAADVVTANAVLTGGAVTQDSAAFAITPAAASQLVYTTQPGGGTAGVTWAQQPVVQVQDPYGNRVSTGSDSSVVVTLAKTTGTGVVSGALSKQAIGGVADFSDNALSLNLTGSDKMLTASATITAGAVTKTSNAFTIAQGAASQLVFSTQPGGGIAHVTWGQQPVVQVQDKYGNVVTTGADSMVNIALTLTSGSGALAGATTVTAASGQASFGGLEMDAAGTKQITATAAALSPGSTSGVSNSFSIVPSTATTVAFVQQPSPSSVSQVAWARQPVVSISDSYGNRVTSGPDATANVTLSMTTGAGTLSGTLSLSAAGGMADFTGHGLNIDLIGSDKVLTATKADTSGSGGTAAATATTAAFSITNGTATHLAFAAQPVGAAATANLATQPIVQILDAAGNQVTSGVDATANISVSLSLGTGNLSGTTTVAASGGVATFAGLSVNLVGSKRLTATKADTANTTAAGVVRGTAAMSAVSNTFTIITDTALQLVFTTQPGGGTAGQAWGQQPVVQIQDAHGNLITTGADATATVTLTLSSGAGSLAGTVSRAAVGGVATFTDIKKNLIGSADGITAAATLNGAPVTQASNSFVVSAAAASQLVVATQPGGGTAGVVWSQQPVVQVQDVYGNLVSTGSDSTVVVTLALTTGSGTLKGALAKQTQGGIASFADSALSLNLVGADKVLTAGATLTAGPVTVASHAFTITAAGASALVFLTQPGGGLAHLAWGQQPVVQVQDAYGNGVTTGSDSTVNIALTLTTGTGALAGGTTTVTAASGQAAFVGLYINAAGAKKLTATAAALAQGSTSVVSGSYTIAPNTATTVAFATQPSASTVSLAAFAQQPVVTISDSYGNLITSGPDATAAVTLTLTGGTGTLGGTASIAAAGGVADFTGGGLNIESTGANKVLTATKVSTAGGGGTGALTATSNAFAITAGSATSIAYQTQPTGAVAGANLATQPVLKILDAAGNTVTTGVDATANISIALSSGSGILSGTTTVAASNGIATFAGLSINATGAKVLTAQKADTASTTAAGAVRGTPAASVASNSFTMTQDTAVNLVFTTQPGGGTAGQVWGQQPVVQIQDAHGNLITTGADAARVITVALTSGSGALAGTLTATASGGIATFASLKKNIVGSADVITASATLNGASVTQTSAPFVITAAAASQIVYVQQPGGGTAAAVWATAPVVQVQDPYGNLVSTGSDSTVVVTLALTTGTGVVSGALTRQAIAGVADFSDNALSLNLTGLNKVLTASATIAAGAVTAVSNPFTITANTATQLVFTTQPGGGTAHATWAQQPVVTIADAYGNAVTTGADSNRSIVLTLTGGTGSITGTTTLSATAGVAPFAGLSIDAAGSKQLTATAAALSTGSTSVTSSSFSITPAAAITVAFTTQPSASSVSLVIFARQPVLTISDSYGNLITSGPDATAIVTLAQTGGSGTLGGTLSMSAVGGVADFTGHGLNIDLAGANKVLTATKASTAGSGGAGALTATTGAFAIIPASATSIAFQTQPTGAVGGASLGTQPVLKILDAAGNTVTTGVDATANVSLAISSGTGVLSGTKTVAASLGIATFAGLSIDLTGAKVLTATKADTASITAAGVLRGTPAVSVASNSLTITQDAAVNLVFSTQPGGGTAGQVWSQQPVVRIQDAHGNLITTGADAARVVTVALSTGTGALAGTLTATASGGVATFTSVEKNLIGAADVITAAATLNGVSVTQTSTPFVITAAAASQLVYATQPGGGAAGAAWSTQPVVQVQDQYGNLVSSGSDSTVVVTMALTTGTGTLTGALTRQAIGGVASFADNALALNLTGINKVITASATIGAGLVSIASNAFSITANTATQLVFTTQPGGGTAHAAWSQQPVVKIEDAYGNVVTTGADSARSILLTLTSGTGSIGGTATLTTTSGVASFSGLYIDAAGSKNLTATAATLSQGSTSAVSSSFSITPAAATTVVFATQPSASSVSQIAFSQQPVLSIADSYSNIVTTGADATATVTLTLSTGVGTLGGTISMSAAGGIADFTGKGVNIDLTGVNKVLTATKSSTTSSGGAGVLTATSNPFTITNGIAASLSFASQQPVGAAATVNFATQPKVQILDAAGNVVTSGVDASANVTLTLTSGTGVLSGSSTVAASAGVATYAGLSINLAGSKTLTATKADTASTTAAGVVRGTAALSITSNAFSIGLGSATSLIFATQPNGAVAGAVWTQQPVVQIQDAAGNVITTGADATRSVTLSLTSGGGALGGTATKAAVGGVATFTNLTNSTIGVADVLTASAGLTSGLATQISNPFAIVAAAASQVVFATQPGGGTAGTVWSQQPIVVVQDQYGNFVSTSSDSSIVVTLSLSTGTGTLAGALTKSAIGGIADFGDNALAVNFVGSNKVLTAAATITAGAVTVTSNAFTITGNTAMQLVFNTQPGGGTAGSSWATQPVVQVRDIFNNVVTNGNDATAAVAVSSGPSFSTDFESGSPQNVALDVLDAVFGTGAINDGGVCCGATSPQTSPRNEYAHSGSAAVIYTGQAGTAAASSAYTRLFDFNDAPLVITSNTVLTYWIMPESNAQFGGTLVDPLSKFAMLDLIFNDGSMLHSLGVTDQNNIPMTPATQGNYLILGAWNQVAVNLGSLAGKSVIGVDIYWAHTGTASAPYKGYIDDVSIKDTLLLSGTTSLAAVSGVATYTNLSSTVAGKANLTAYATLGNQYINNFETTGPSTNVVDSTAPATGQSANLTGLCCSLTTPETRWATDQYARSATHTVMFSGQTTSNASASFFTQMIDLSATPVPVDANMVLSYWVLPGTHAYDSNITANIASYMVVDVIFTDNTASHSLGMVDQFGNAMTPAGQGPQMIYNAYNYVASSLAPVAGKSIKRIDLYWQHTGTTGAFKGAIDDLRIARPIVTQNSNTYSVAPSAASSIAFATPPSASTVSLVAFAQQPKVTIKDASGNAVTTGPDAAATVTLSLSAGTGTLGGTVSMAAVAGVADFTGKGLNIDLSGTTKVLTATKTSTTGSGGTAAMTATTSAFTITNGSATSLVYSTFPGGATAGAILSPQPVVQILDAAGNLVTSGVDASANVSIAMTTGTGNLGGTTTAAASAGVATFSGLKIDTVGVKQLTATKADTASTTSAGTIRGSASASVVSGSFSITYGSATQLVFASQPSGGAAGAVWATQPVVQIQDANGNLVTSGSDATRVVTLTLTTGSGAVSGTLTATASGGVATFSGLSLSTVGVADVLTATAPLTVGSTTKTSQIFAITPAAASQLVFTTQPGGGASNTNWATQPVVKVEDQYGNIVTSGTDSGVLITMSLSTGTGSLAGTISKYAWAGVADFTQNLLSVNLIGANKVLTASATIVAGAVTNTSSAFTITNGPASQVVFFTQPSPSTAAGTAWAAQPVVQILDTAGNLVTTAPDATTNITLTHTGGGALTGTTTVAASGGVATFSGLSLSVAGTNHVLTATKTDTTGSSGTAAFTSVSNTFTITAATASQIVFSIQPNNTAAAVAFASQPVVQVQDTYGNIVLTGSDSTVSVVLTLTTGTGTLSGTTTLTASAGVAGYSGLSINLNGSKNITATATLGAGSRTAVSASFTIVAGPASKIAFTTQPGGGAAGSAWATQPVVAVEDAQSNLVPAGSDASVTVTLAQTGASVGTLAGTNAVAASSGVATFAGLNSDKTGTSQQLLASATIGAGAVTATSNTYTISAGATLAGDWPFTSGTDASYSFGSSIQISSGGMAQLLSTSTTDANSSDFSATGSSMVGVAYVGTVLALGNAGGCDATATNCASFDASWVPQWGNLLGYWGFEGTTNATVAANSNIAATAGSLYLHAVNAGLTYKAGQVGNALLFNGSNDYMTLPIGTDQNSRTMTVMGWVNWQVNSNYQKWFDFGGGTDADLEYTMTSDGQNAYAKLTWNQFVSSTVTHRTVAVGSWNHTAVVADSDSLKVYINGVLAGTAGGVPDIGNIMQQGSINYIGKSPFSDPYYNGYLDEMAIWSTALNANEIYNIYRRQGARHAGLYTSRVMDAQSTQNWNSIAWSSIFPFHKPLPSTNVSESTTVYSSLANSNDENGLLYLWHLDEPSDIVTQHALDDTTSGNHGLYESGYGWSSEPAWGLPGMFGRCVALDGVNHASHIATTLSVTSPSAYTISLWFNSHDQTGGRIFGFGDRQYGMMNTYQDRQLYLTDTGLLAFGFLTAVGTKTVVQSSTAYNDGFWHHAVASYDTTNGATLTVDVAGAGGNTTLTPKIYTGYWRIGSDTMTGWGSAPANTGFTGLVDEVAVFNRALTASEVSALWRRGATRARFQVRTCALAACGENPNWLGPDGTANTYFSEYHNTLNGNWLATGPNLIFANFNQLTLNPNRYFQYRIALETDDAGTSCSGGHCSPKISSVAVSPNHVDVTSPSISNVTPASYLTLTSMTTTLGTCAGGVNFTLSNDGVLWYWYNGSNWVLSNNTVAQSSASTALTNAVIASFTTQVGTGRIFFNAFLNASSVAGCQLDRVQFAGTTYNGTTYTLGGTVSGLVSGSVTVNNGVDSVTVGNGSYTFNHPLLTGASYNASITSPPGQTCVFSGSGFGTMAASNITNLNVSCTPKTYTIMGAVSGLSGFVTVQNGADTKTVGTNSTFAFPTAVAFGSSYSVTVSTQPTTQSCVVVNGSGTMGAASPTVAIACMNNYVNITSAAATATAGTAFSLTVTATNAFGVTVAGYTGTITFSSSDANAQLPPAYTFVAGDNGTHTFTNLTTLKSAGSQTVRVTDTPDAYYASQKTFVVSPAAIAALQMTTPSTAIAGSSSQVIVRGVDTYNNPVPSYTGTVTFTSNDYQAVYNPPTYTFVAADLGSHTFPAGVVWGTSGTRWLRVTDNSARVSNANSTVVAGALNSLRLGYPYIVTNATNFSPSLSGVDVYGNVVSSYTGTVSLASTDAGGTPPSGTPKTVTFVAGNAGIQTVANLRFATLGYQTLTASDSGNSISGKLGYWVRKKGNWPANNASASYEIGWTNFTTPTSGTSNQLISWSRGIYVAPNGALYISDVNNNRVVALTSVPTSNDPTFNYVVGQTIFTNSAMGVDANSFNQPATLSGDGNNGLFVSDSASNRVLHFNSLPTAYGNANQVIGQATMFTNAANCTATGLSQPQQVLAVPNANVTLIADAGQSRVLIYTPMLSMQNGRAASLVLGQPNLTTCNAGTSTASTFSAPAGLYSDGNILVVTDYPNNRVLIFNSLATILNNGVHQPSADVVIGQNTMTASALSAANPNAATLSAPICADSDGTQLFISDYSNKRVMIYSTVPTTNGAVASFVIGEASMTANSTASSATQFNYAPSALNVYGDRLIVADESRVMIWAAP